MKNTLLAVISAALLVLPVAMSAQTGSKTRWAVVRTSSCFLRAAPDYESSNESQCLMGTVLEVTGEDRYWRKVNAPDYRDCWTNDLVLAYMTEAEKDAYIAAPKYICIAERSHIYSGPSSTAGRISDFTMGNLVRIAPGAGSSADGEWKMVTTADGNAGWVRSLDVADFGGWALSRRPDGRSLVELAKKLIGTPYMWGGNSVNYFDCSGLVKFVYWMNGIVLPRNAREQILCGDEVPCDISAMRPGDLLFYGRKSADGRPVSVTHVAMYIGDGQIIHSSQLVRVNSVRKSDPDYYGREPIAARRILGNVDCGKGAVSVSRYPFCFKQ